METHELEQLIRGLPLRESAPALERRVLAPRRGGWIARGLAAAAAVALAAALALVFLQPQRTENGAAPGRAVALLDRGSQMDELDSISVTSWQLVDEGYRLTDDGQAVQVLRRQVVTQTWRQDPQTQQWASVVQPSEELILVEAALY